MSGFETVESFQMAVATARAAAAAYYDTDTQVMTDAAYDALIDAIQVAKDSHPDWDDDGLLDQVAAGASAGGEVTHPTPMLSLAKAKERDDVAAFVASLRAPAVVEVKLDGLATRAVYTDGTLTLLATRGDGTTGEDVTSQAHLLSGLPATLATPVSLEVRGEVFMTDADFETANTNRVAAGKPAFVNPRNATAGSLRNADLAYRAPMTFAAYDASGGPLEAHTTYLDRMAALADLGITTAVTLAPVPTASAQTPEQALDIIDAIHTARANLGFPIDGAVVKADAYTDRDRLGTASRTPRWAVAFKYPADVATTVLRDIEVAVGRTGRISLRAVLDPVFVAGTTVTFATLHNPKFVTDADFRLGDTVYVYRAGDVIPRVNAVDLTRRPASAVAWTAPATCPQCGQPWDTSSLLWRCHTPECSIAGWLEFAASRDVLDIEGFSTATVEAAIDAGLVSDLADLLALTADQLAALPVGDGSRLLGPTVAAKLAAQIDAAKNQPLARQITSWNIRTLGRTLGRRLAAHFTSLDALLAATETDLAEVEGVGPEKARIIHTGLANRRPMIDRLVDLGITTTAPTASAAADDAGSLPLTGKTVVVSGSVPGLSRTEANEWVERLGGKSSGSVSKNTSLLVAGDGSGSKSEKAAALGVPVMRAEDFAALVAAHQ